MNGLCVNIQSLLINFDESLTDFTCNNFSSDVEGFSDTWLSTEIGFHWVFGHCMWGGKSKYLIGTVHRLRIRDIGYVPKNDEKIIVEQRTSISQLSNFNQPCSNLGVQNLEMRVIHSFISEHFPFLWQWKIIFLRMLAINIVRLRRRYEWLWISW